VCEGCYRLSGGRKSKRGCADGFVTGAPRSNKEGGALTSYALPGTDIRAKWQGHLSSPSPAAPGVPLLTWHWIWWPGTSRRSCQSPRQLNPVSCTPSRRISPDRNNLEIRLCTMTLEFISGSLPKTFTSIAPTECGKHAELVPVKMLVKKNYY
jgi:hypothetical protein